MPRTPCNYTRKLSTHIAYACVDHSKVCYTGVLCSLPRDLSFHRYIHTSTTLVLRSVRGWRPAAANRTSECKLQREREREREMIGQRVKCVVPPKLSCSFSSPASFIILVQLNISLTVRTQSRVYHSYIQYLGREVLYFFRRISYS